MTNIIIVNKNSDVKTLKCKNINYTNLYKKCGFKKENGFSKRNSWKVKIDDETHEIQLWARDSGNANTENKYDFPPPCDNKLYFGNCCLIKVCDDNIVNLDVSLWNKIYEKLFGGFDDLNEEESLSDDELDDVPDKFKTKDGYLKDNFVVDSDPEQKNTDEVSADEASAISDSSSDSDDDSELDEDCYSYSSDDD